MTVLISLALIFAYTYRGGLKTIIIWYFTNIFLVTSVFLTIVFICNSLDFSAIEAFER
jgi:O-antigen/teichoic acid export membrane protein